MAYIIQQRRDTLENWNRINPILAESEIGFILDLDDKGKQKSSLYKIGDGVTPWIELPLFGFSGNVYNDFQGSDLTTSVASRQAILNKLSEIINGTEDVEGLVNKLSDKQLVQALSLDTEENPLQLEEVENITKNQIVSRWVLLQEFQRIWDDFSEMENHLIESDKDLVVLKEFAETFGPVIEAHTESIDKHEKELYGWMEEKETDETDPETGEPIIETIEHKGLKTRVESLEQQHVILTEDEFNELTSYEEGKLYFTYTPETTE